MINPLPILLRFLCVGLIALALPVVGQIPNTLVHSIPAPAVGVQSSAQFGYSVAVDGGYAVVGAPYDDIGGTDSGVVKVFSSTTSSLLFVLPNPSPAKADLFGWSVGISGTRVIVGAPYDDTGANDTGSAYLYDLSSGTPTVPVATLTIPSPSGSVGFGYSVGISGTRLIVGANLNIGKAYVYELSGETPTLLVTLDNPSPASFDYFGTAVAISGTRAVVGAYWDDTGGSDAGSAYVFDLNSGTPAVPVATLINPSPVMNDYFGRAVAISGSRVVVGAYGDDTGGGDTGSTYVYDLNSGTPTVPLATLNNPGTGPIGSDYFGYAVAISGTRVVVGAVLNDTGTSDAGRAYVYDMASVTPTVPVTMLNNPSPAFDDQFGWSVAISGTHVVAGARKDDTGAENAGSAYVFDLGSGTPSVPVATLNNPGPASGDLFGNSIAISGTRMVVGAYQDDTGGTDAGRAYVYDLGNGTPTVPVFTLNNPSPTAQDYFGYAVAISGTRVVVGAHKDDAGTTDSGRAYVYNLSSGTPIVPFVTLNNPGPGFQDNFGYAVAISGTRVVVGAYRDDTGASDSGSVYVYDVSSGTPTVPVATLSNPSPGSQDNFGNAVALSGTLLVVGAWQDDTGATDAGRAYVYDLASGTPTVPVATFNNPVVSFGDSFGNSVAISGTRVVVGAYRHFVGATNSGSAYVFDLTSGTPTLPVLTLNNPDPASGDYFGNSVAISGTRVVVGAYLDNTGAFDTGSAYVYDITGVIPTVPVATLTNPGLGDGDGFATSVALDGLTVAIGTPLDDSVLADKGYVYVFRPASPDFDNDGLLDSWEETYWPGDTSHSALDDWDKDGYCELLELALGLSPLVSNAGGLPPVTDEGGYLTMTITKQAGVTYEVQSAGTLLPAMPDSFNASTTTVLIDDATTLKVRDNFLITAEPGRFMRVKVTAAP